jgi:hypothetical protein
MIERHALAFMQQVGETHAGQYCADFRGTGAFGE